MTAAALIRTDGGGTRLLTPPGVYAPQYDTELLARALSHEALTPTSEVLDIGTGSGALAVRAARLGARVTAVDISRRAVLTARVNAMLARQRVRVRHGDLTKAVPGRTFDFVISNPPYVPAPSGQVPVRGAARAWDAGFDGRAVLDRICDAAPSVLRPRGVLLIVHSALSGPQATVDRLADRGLDAAVVDRARIPFGPVLRSRTSWLRSQGLLAGQDDAKEELVVIRATRA